MEFSLKRLERYLSSLYNAEVSIEYLDEIGKKLGMQVDEIKEFGYGVPYVLEFSAGGKLNRVILETIRSGGFGHDHFSDRAQILIWQHSAFNKLSKHVHSIDVGAFNENGSITSLGDCKEFFIITSMVEGQPYSRSLDRIKEEKSLTQLDLDRCQALSDYIVQVHKEKKEAPQLYLRRIRELVGHEECILGLIDSYPSGLEYVSESDFQDIEKKCVAWRWKLKRKVHRCAQVHGDFHPWNLLFRKGTDFSVLDRSRGEWGEPADDVSAMSINYLFYSLQTYGKLTGPFEALHRLFIKNYVNRTCDEELHRVIQPFYVWRGLVIASPIWYPNITVDVRVKLINFIRNMLENEEVDLENLNSYITNKR